jgi:hypothetical protein
MIHFAARAAFRRCGGDRRMKTILLAAVVALGATAAVSQAPSKPVAPVTKPKAAQSGTPAGRTATVTTKSGKKITYDCSKKGNMNKKACKA